jgi:hypothetical protein
MRKKKLWLQWVEEDTVVIPITARPDGAPSPATKRPLILSAKPAKLRAPLPRRSLPS